MRSIIRCTKSQRRYLACPWAPANKRFSKRPQVRAPVPSKAAALHLAAGRALEGELRVQPRARVFAQGCSLLNRGRAMPTGATSQYRYACTCRALSAARHLCSEAQKRLHSPYIVYTFRGMCMRKSRNERGDDERKRDTPYRSMPPHSFSSSIRSFQGQARMRLSKVYPITGERKDF